MRNSGKTPAPVEDDGPTDRCVFVWLADDDSTLHVEYTGMDAKLARSLLEVAPRVLDENRG